MEMHPMMTVSVGTLHHIKDYPYKSDMEVDDDVLPAIEESEEAPAVQKAFIPGRHTLEKDEVLEPDNSTYEMLHMMGVDWSSLSFDILKDNLGDERQRYPASAYVVTGTQADIAKNNELHVFKISSLCRTFKEDGMCFLPASRNEYLCCSTLIM